MQYVLLLYTDPAHWQAQGEAHVRTVVEEHEKLIDELKSRGGYLGSNALEFAPAATTVRVREGRSLVTDGPFAETREQLGGYYVIEARDLDEAMAVAARIPDAAVGAVEIRPVKHFDL